jgi:hypothetical protein
MRNKDHDVKRKAIGKMMGIFRFLVFILGTHFCCAYLQHAVQNEWRYTYVIMYPIRRVP